MNTPTPDKTPETFKLMVEQEQGFDVGWEEHCAKLEQQRDAKTQERDKLARENDALTELLNQQSKEVSNMNNKTCIHHNDKEREEIECPVCLKKERNEWQGLANDLKQANETLKRVCDKLAESLKDCQHSIYRTKYNQEALDQYNQLPENQGAATGIKP